MWSSLGEDIAKVFATRGDSSDGQSAFANDCRSIPNRDETSCRNGALTWVSGAVAQFGRVGVLGRASHRLSQTVILQGVAGVAGLEPVTSAVTGQRSNQLSYTPARSCETRRSCFPSQRAFRKIRAADAKEVGVGNPAEETYCCPNQIRRDARFSFGNVNCVSPRHPSFWLLFRAACILWLCSIISLLN